MSHDITVYHLHAGPSPSPTRLLDNGRSLVNAAIESCWRSVNVAPNPTTSSSKTASFVWAKAPPKVPRASQCVPELEEWDAPLDEQDEIVDVSALPDFERTDFSMLPRSSPRSKRKSCESSLVRHFADDVDVNLDTRMHKRRRSHSPSHISISTLISLHHFQPHYLESPDPARPPPPGIEKIPAFHSIGSISFRPLTMPFARTAWLVPLRGCPPFDGASPARLTSATNSTAVPPHLETPSMLCVQWTPFAITQFWRFLLRQRSMNNFGPLSLSYAFSPLCYDDALLLSGGGKAKQHEGETAPWDRREWEYVKIYHDAQYAMKLRSLLDSFRWEEPGCDGSDAPRQNRALKGARLVLVDEQGNLVVLA